ncbi:MAG: PEP-utilizing enzyme [bacterium]
MSKKYIIINEEPNVNILGLDPILKGFHSSKLKKFTGRNFSISFYELKNDKFRFGGLEEEWREYSKYLFEKIMKNPSFEKDVVLSVENIAEKIYTLCKSALLRLKNNEIAEEEKKKLVEELFSLFMDLCSYGLIGAIISFGGVEIQKLLEEIVKGKIKNLKKINEYIPLLTYRYYESYDHKGVKALSIIAQKIYEDKNLKNLLLNSSDTKKIFNGLPEKIKEDIKEYIFEWGWLTYSYRGPEYTIDNAIAGIKELISFSGSPENYAKNIIKEFKNNSKRQAQVLKNLNLSAQEKHIIHIAQNITYTKELRTKMMFLADFTINELLKFFAKKENFTMRQIGVCTMREITNYFKLGKLPSKETLNKRLKYSILLTTEKNEKIFIGAKAKNWINKNVKIEKFDKNITEFSGQVACAGSVNIIRGKVKIINVAKDMKKFNKEDILVSVGTTPEIVPVMKKSSAIITDLGGLTCHAAIVSRELKKPCIIGTRIATKILHDGDEVEVNAERGIVKILKK